MTADSRLEADGFVPFFRSYTKTWIHAIATAGLTAFGTLTIVHNSFAVLALAVYVIPPIVLYLHRQSVAEQSASAAGPDTEPGEGSEPDADAESDTAAEADAGAQQRTAASETESRLDSDPASERGPDSQSEPTVSANTEPTSVTNGEPTAESTLTGSAEDDTSESADSRPDRESVGGSRPENGSGGGGSSGVGDKENNGGEGDSSGGDEGSSGVGDEDRSDDSDPTAAREWTAVDAPTDATLRDVAVSPSGTAHAVGDGGTVLVGGEEWSVVLEDGPAAGGNDLRGADVTADGEAVWVAGDSGALGQIDTETGRHTDYTAPEDITDNWLGVAVGGASGAETILLINGSGAVLRGQNREGDLEWAGPDKPGSGSSFSGIALCEGGVGYCCDTNDGVYETTDGGETFERVGLEGADGTLTDVATAGRADCLVSADDGVTHRYGGSTWTPERVADGSLAGVDRAGERAVACADDVLYERTASSAEWERIDTDASDPLLAVSIGPENGVAVGENGTVIEEH